MKYPRVILFLGAGASQFAGYFTFVEFPQLLFDKQLREYEGLPPLGSKSEKILSAIRGSLDRNGIATTHDNFLWRLDGYTQLLRLNQKDEALQEYLKDNSKLYELYLCTQQAVQQITASTIGHYSKNRVSDDKPYLFEKLTKVYQLYRSLAKLNANGVPLPIFTTNYDMLIEDLVYKFYDTSGMEVLFANGMPGYTRELSAWNPTEYNLNMRDMGGFHLHRLHGCVCWFYHAQGDRRVYFHRNDASQQNEDQLCAMYPGRETEIGTGPHGHSFRLFYRYLQHCELAVFIGFSFRDDDVMHVILKALSERKGKLKILVIDRLYTRDDIRNKLENSGNRTPFPTRLPKDSEVDSLAMEFPKPVKFDEDILDKCQIMLSNKRGTI